MLARFLLPGVLLLGSVSLISAQSCPTGYTYTSVVDVCYRLYTASTNIYSYEDGEAQCSSDGGLLAYGRNNTEYSFINDITNGISDTPFYKSWIGLNDRVTEDSFVWTSGNECTGICRLYFSLFLSPHQNRDCVLIRQGFTFEPFDCSTFLIRSFLCYVDAIPDETTSKKPTTTTKKPTTTTAEPTTTACNPCPENYIFNDTLNLCYRLFEERPNYQDALDICENDGSVLASAQSEELNSFIFDLTRSATTGSILTWAGLFYDKDMPSDRFYSDNTTFIDGTSFENWIDGQPDSVSSDNMCVVIDNNQEWRLILCSRTAARRVVCVTDSHCPITCPENYTRNETLGLCYRLIVGRITYADALSTCTSDSAVLASAKSEELNSFIFDLTRSSSDNVLVSWVGLTYDGDDASNRFYADNTPFVEGTDFDNWGNNQPVDNDAFECVILTNAAEWRLIRCDRDVARSIVCITS